MTKDFIYLISIFLFFSCNDFPLDQKPNNLKNHLLMYQQSCQQAKYLLPFWKPLWDF